MAAIQEALIASEEQRLEVSRALLDFKLENNKAMESAETVQYELQQKIIELEGLSFTDAAPFDPSKTLAESLDTAAKDAKRTVRVLSLQNTNSSVITSASSV